MIAYRNRLMTTGRCAGPGLPVSSWQVLELLAERGTDVSYRTILTWARAFGPLMAAEVNAAVGSANAS